jgi:hypothetical protein
MKTLYKITLFILVCLIYAGCQREKGCSEEPSQTFYHNIDSYYKELVPFGKPGFTMELTDSATGQKVKFTFNGIDSGYWKELNQGLNPINCPKSDFDAYQYYNYNCVSSNDSLLKINLCLIKEMGYPLYNSNYFDMITYNKATNQLGVILEGKGVLIGIQFFKDLSYSKFYSEIVINDIKYRNVLVSKGNYNQTYPIVYFNNENGIIALKTEGKLFQKK